MKRRMGLWILLALLAGCGGGGGGTVGGGGEPPSDPPPAPVPFVTVAPVFVDVTSAAGVFDAEPYADLDYRAPEAEGISPYGAGACAGDYDGDGWVDLYHIRGATGRNRLYRNQGDGTFVDVAAAAGVDLESRNTCGPTFADYDGDGDLDLFVGGLLGTPARLFRNRGDGTFEDATAAAGLDLTRINNMSASFGDYDRDGDLDLYVTHWETVGLLVGAVEHLWRNKGDGTFEDVSGEAALSPILIGTPDYSFTANFVDINEDRWPDILLVADFATSRILLNQCDGTFADVTSAVITDQAGMGTSVADYDNDGDLDWFVTSISRPGDDVGPDPSLYGGNRMYRNTGDGTFEDATSEAGVRAGSWGWASIFADLNNDCWLDIYHTNGWFGTRVSTDASVLFVSKGDGTFDEVAESSGAIDRGQGRGVVAFDYDRDGDIDLFQANLNEPARLFRNDTPQTLHWLRVALQGPSPNTQGVGARITITTGGLTQMRELRCGNNYVSANPVDAHFGLGVADTVDTLRVLWPDDEVTLLEDVPADQVLTIPHPAR